MNTRERFENRLKGLIAVINELPDAKYTPGFLFGSVMTDNPTDLNRVLVQANLIAKRYPGCDTYTIMPRNVVDNVVDFETDYARTLVDFEAGTGRV